MKITSELLQTIYTRAEQYAMARWDRKSPNQIELQEDGTIKVTWEYYRCGDYDYDYEYIDVENLTEDLDVVVQERKKKEEEARLAMEHERKFQEEKRLAQEKERRRAEYLKFKKEFEPQ
jgi:hypothetical protein